MKRISVALFLVLALGITAAAQELYVANWGTNTVSHIVRNRVVANIAIGGNPFDVAATADGKYVYVSQRTGNGVAVIDTTTDTFQPAIGGIVSPEKMAVSGDDSMLFVASYTVTGPHVTIIDITKNADGTRRNVLAGTITLPAGMDSAYAVAAYGAFLAVGTASGHVALYDASTNPPTLLASRLIGTAVQHLAFAPGGTKLYAALALPIDTLDENGNVVGPANLHVLRVSTLQVKSVMELGTYEGLASSAIADARYLYVSSVFDQLFVVDTATDMLAAPPLTIPGNLWGVAASGNLFVVNRSFDAIQIVRTGRAPAGNRIDGTIALEPGAAPYGIAVVERPKGRGGK